MLQVFRQRTHPWNAFCGRETRADNNEKTLLKMVLKLPFHCGKIQRHI